MWLSYLNNSQLSLPPQALLETCPCTTGAPPPAPCQEPHAIPPLTLPFPTLPPPWPLGLACIGHQEEGALRLPHARTHGAHVRDQGSQSSTCLYARCTTCVF